MCSQFEVDDFLSGNIEHTHISPAQVADPRPGPANLFQDDAHTTTTYQHLHIVSSDYEKYSFHSSNLISNKY